MADPDRTLHKTDQVYCALRQRIRDLELPPGVLLKKEDLAAAFGVSRAPVSEAIARLTAEGLVDVFPQHGSFVAEIRSADVREGLFVRCGIETEAMRQVARTWTPELMAHLDRNICEQAEVLARGDLRRFYELDEEMHDSIVDFLQLPRARKLLDSVRAQLDRVRRLTLPSEGRPEATLREHQILVEALRSRDPEFAAAAMRAHLAAVAMTAEQQIEDHHVQMSA